MAEIQIRYNLTSEANILALTSDDVRWKENAFYYPTDKDYFYQLRGGIMIPIGKKSSDYVNNSQGIGLGVKLNGQVIGGVKTLIEKNDILEIPYLYDYNTFKLQVDGIVRNAGITRIM